MNPSTTTVVRLDEQQIEEAGAALARGFVDDALARHFLPDPQERARLIPWHFSALVRYGYLFGEVWTTTERADGAAVWLPPGDLAMTPERLEQAGIHRAPDILGAEAWQRLTSVLGHLEPLRAIAVPTDHWYLMLLGVDLALQRKGIGSALLAPTLERADRERLPCYLETMEAHNVLFYERHSFVVVTSEVEPGSGLRFWTMRRDPRA